MEPGMRGKTVQERVDRREFFRQAWGWAANQGGTGSTSTSPPKGGQIGVAVITQSRCLAWDDQPCQLCLIRCPLAGEALYLEELKPVVVAEKCTGCGMCEQACSMMNGEWVAIQVKGIQGEGRAGARRSREN